MKHLYSIIFCLTFCILYIACKKSPEQKLVGKWKIEAAFVNGTDRTSELDTLHILYYEFKKVDIGSREPQYVYRMFLEFDTANAIWEDSCNFSGWTYLGYDINDKKSEIILGAIHSYSKTFGGRCSINNSFIPALIVINNKNEIWQIKKWKRNNFWVELNYNGNIYETHFTK